MTVLVLVWYLLANMHTGFSFVFSVVQLHCNFKGLECLKSRASNSYAKTIDCGDEPTNSFASCCTTSVTMSPCAPGIFVTASTVNRLHVQPTEQCIRHSCQHLGNDQSVYRGRYSRYDPGLFGQQKVWGSLQSLEKTWGVISHQVSGRRQERGVFHVSENDWVIDSVLLFIFTFLDPKS